MHQRINSTSSAGSLYRHPDRLSVRHAATTFRPSFRFWLVAVLVGAMMSGPARPAVADAKRTSAS